MATLLLEYEGECRYRIVSVQDNVKHLLLKALRLERGVLHCVELIYLVQNYNVLPLTIDGKSVKSLDELLREIGSRNSNVWVQYEVYFDLKRRGRIAIPGPRELTLLVYNRKQGKFTHYILVLEQGSRVPISLIRSFIEEAFKNDWEPVLAIVDAYGDITYYSPRLLNR